MKVKKMTKKQLTKIRVDNIKDRMKIDDKFLLQCMLKIFSFQTEEEKVRDTSLNLNGVGFNGFDGKFLCSLSNQYIRKGNLSTGQMKCMKKSMAKYAGQIDQLEYANVIYLDGEQLIIPMIAEKLFPDCDVVVLDKKGKKEYTPYNGENGGVGRWERSQIAHRKSEKERMEREKAEKEMREQSALTGQEVIPFHVKQRWTDDTTPPVVAIGDLSVVNEMVEELSNNQMDFLTKVREASNKGLLTKIHPDNIEEYLFGDENAKAQTK